MLHGLGVQIGFIPGSSADKAMTAIHSVPISLYVGGGIIVVVTYAVWSLVSPKPEAPNLIPRIVTVFCNIPNEHGGWDIALGLRVDNASPIAGAAEWWETRLVRGFTKQKGGWASIQRDFGTKFGSDASNVRLVSGDAAALLKSIAAFNHAQGYLVARFNGLPGRISNTVVQLRVKPIGSKWSKWVKHPLPDIGVSGNE